MEEKVEEEDKMIKKSKSSKYEGKRFAFTVHGAENKDKISLTKWFDGKLEDHPWNGGREGPSVFPEVSAAVISKEFGKNKIHPHWQGYFELAHRAKIKGHFQACLGHDNFHIEKCYATKKYNVRYVYGIDKAYEIGWIVYKKNIETPREYNPQPYKFWKNLKLREWQSELLPMLTKKVVNDREIIYIWDSEGNTGKTVLAKYLHTFHGAIVAGGKDSDMKHAITRWQEITSKYPAIIIVDICRSDFRTDYSGIESLKNGLFFSGKYESAMLCSYNLPNVVVFSNFPPEEKNLSKDRWKIGNIKDGKIIWK